MLTTNYRSLDTIFSKLLANPNMNGITPSDVASYTLECISFIGVPMAYENKVTVPPIEICDHRGDLPCDIVYIQQTRKRSGNLLAPMRYSTDTFTSGYHESGSPDVVSTANLPKDYYYSLNGGKIYTGFEEGQLEMSYKAVKTDEDGFPMIPDNEKYSRAVEAYIKLKWYEIQWELGNLPDKVLARADREYCFAVGSAQNYGHLQSLDQAESFTNMITNLVGNSLASKNYFQDLGRQHYFKTGSI